MTRTLHALDRFGRACLALAVVAGFATLIHAAWHGNVYALAALVGMAVLAAGCCAVACVRSAQISRREERR